MKKILTIAAAALMMAACGQKNENQFTLKGTIAEAEGQQVVLSYGSRTDMKSDTTVVKDGAFEFNVQMDKPYYGGTLLVGEFDRTGQTEPNYAQIALEPGTMTIDAPDGKLANATIKGGSTQDDINAYEATVKPIISQMNDLSAQMRQEGANVDSLRSVSDALREKYGEISKQFFTTHPDSYLSPSLYQMEVGRATYEEIKAFYDGLSDRVKQNSPEAEEIAKELATLENVQPGHEAPDFTAKDIDGNDFTLSSLKGKVVIIDFWASWCKPCRASNPHMVGLYKKYHDRGLEMVYVSDDDSNPDKWREAVEKDGLVGDGFHHVLRGLKRVDGPALFDHTNDISDKFAIHYLPTKYLIDREGKIVCKINEGEDAKIDEQIESLLK